MCALARIYDNMKTAVEAVFIGKDRQFNRRFLRMCGHYLVEPVACTPAAGWEKGQVENQVGNIRERLFVPRLRIASYAQLNAWLLDQSSFRLRPTAIPNRPTGRSGRCSRRSARSWCRSSSLSTGSGRRSHECTSRILLPRWVAATQPGWQGGKMALFGKNQFSLQ